MARKRLDPETMHLHGQTIEWVPGRRSLEWFEDHVITETLRKLDYNRIVTASVLGISVRTLRTKLAKLRSLGVKVDR